MTELPEFSDLEPEDDRDAELVEFWAWTNAQDREPQIDFTPPRTVEDLPVRGDLL